ncbi:MAG: hypothetical protein ACI857_001711 [Arenicella sp.]|jgi:hypothetical protein
MYKILFLITLLPFSGFTQSSSLAGFNFPEKFEIDPSDYSLEKLGVKKIVQYEENRSIFYADSTKNAPVHYFLQYALIFDSLGRLKNFQFDFQINKGEVINPVDWPVGPHTFIDSSHIFTYEMNNKKESYNYFEYTFEYFMNDLHKVSVFNPLPYRGTIDGVYVKQIYHEEDNTNLIKYYDDRGLLIRSEYYFNKGLVKTKKYLYTEVDRNDFKSNLLTSVETIDDFGGHIRLIDYEFE